MTPHSSNHLRPLHFLMRPKAFSVQSLALMFFMSLGVMALSGCTTPVGDSEKSKTLEKELDRWKKESEKQSDERVRITDFPKAGERIPLEKHGWLRSITLDMPVPKNGGSISAQALAQMLRAKGINVMSSLPLDGYQYNGFGLSNVDGVTALELLFGPMGLDFKINDEKRYVTIVPNQARTFYLKIGNTQTKYKSGMMTGNVGSDSGSSGGSSGTTGGNLVSGVETGLDTGTGEVTIDGKFWDDLKNDIGALLKQCIPTYSATAGTSGLSQLPPMPAEMGGLSSPMYIPPAGTGSALSSATGGSLCSEQTVGTFSVNPSVGAVTVQAPHWIMESVAQYMNNVKADNAVTLIYEGMLIAVTNNKERNEGVDIMGFATFANGEFGMSISNNGLGGITVTPPTTGSATTILTPAADIVENSVIGFTKLAGNPAQIFLNYLQQNGEFTILQKPRVAVANGIPGEFAQYDTLYYNQIQQTTSGGNDSSSVGTSNQLVPFKVGSLLRIVPFYDAETGYVHSPITFTQSVQTGTYETTQYVTSTDGDISEIPSTIPLIRDSNYAGQVRMKDGDMIILGGQASERNSSTGSGMPGYNSSNNWFSALLGTKSFQESNSTYYLALTLRVNK